VNDYTAPGFSTTPVDGESAALLAAGGLERRLVDATDTDARRHWHLVTARGFHEAAQHLVLTLLTAGSQPDGTGVEVDGLTLIR